MMMKKLFTTVTMLLVILTIVSCSNKETVIPAEETIVAETEKETTVVELEKIEETTVVETEKEEEITVVEADEETGFGAVGAQSKTEFTLEDMLTYAIQDEYLAFAEYDLIIKELNITRPFTNIIKAEETHISYLEELYEDYGFVIPTIDPSQHTILPESINDAFVAGVQAEIINIAMYEQFLEQELPDDVRTVFEALKKGSESHLLAFQKNVR